MKLTKKQIQELVALVAVVGLYKWLDKTGARGRAKK